MESGRAGLGSRIAEQECVSFSVNLCTHSVSKSHCGQLVNPRKALDHCLVSSLLLPTEQLPSLPNTHPHCLPWFQELLSFAKF